MPGDFNKENIPPHITSASSHFLIGHFNLNYVKDIVTSDIFPIISTVMLYVKILELITNSSQLFK